jgi:cyclopropane-fatty-acyl-phospholipid synthase
MSLFSLEHGKWAYWADFIFYGAAVLVLSITIGVLCPREQWAGSALLALGGWSSWSIIEYGMHRFVLHGLPPFRHWHAKHHQRPTALISAPTLLSASLIAVLVFLPALALGGRWAATAFTLGVLTGYLAYALVHHATHHWRAGNRWSQQRKRWHALHHRHELEGRCYGVTTSLWDHVFGSAPRRVEAPMIARPSSDA